MNTIDWDLLSSYAGLLSLATLSIYAGSYGSLPKQVRVRPGKGEVNISEIDEQCEGENDERMSSEDAWLFPITGSVVLLGFYTIVKYLGTDWINWLLSWYFSIVGIGSVWKSLTALIRWSAGEQRWRSFHRFTFIIQRNKKDVLSLSWRMPTVISFPLAFVPSLLYNAGATSRKSILVTDIFGFSFSHNALTLFKIDSFKTGSILLGGLFFYDIWWVFGTEVMVQVATSLDVPIKLLWPKSLFLAGERGYTMLGLGDVVIPGTFIALALRYDYHRHLSGLPKVPVQQQVKFAKPYFHASLAAYILGLMTTMTAMHVFHTAQPALLYLSPSCVLSFVITAGLRGELGKAWSWNDGSGDQTNKETDISRSADLQGVETKVVEENLNASIINE